MARKILPRKSSKRVKTPNFIYPLVLLAFVSWGGWGYTLLFVQPTTLSGKALFLATLFLALFFTLTFLFYEAAAVLLRKGKPREIFYPAVRRALFVASFVSLSGVMVLTEVANTINLVLFGLILLLTEIQLSRR